MLMTNSKNWTEFVPYIYIQKFNWSMWWCGKGILCCTLICAVMLPVVKRQFAMEICEMKSPVKHFFLIVGKLHMMMSWRCLPLHCGRIVFQIYTKSPRNAVSHSAQLFHLLLAGHWFVFCQKSAEIFYHSKCYSYDWQQFP